MGRLIYGVEPRLGLACSSLLKKELVHGRGSLNAPPDAYEEGLLQVAIVPNARIACGLLGKPAGSCFGIIISMVH